jgi:hypothetical protein
MFTQKHDDITDTSTSGNAAALGCLGGNQRAPPILVVEIPAHRLLDAGLERLLWGPVELIADARGVDCVALIVAGSVGDWVICAT